MMLKMNFMFILILYNILRVDCALCPSRCECDNFENFRRARCNNQNLINVNAGVPPMVQILDLAHNTINTLENHVFRDLNMTSLYNLTLAHNAIHSIGLNALGGLKLLHALDLSYNRLQQLPEEFLWHNHKLKILNLRGNNFWHLNSPFLESHSLTVLDTSKCRIDHISDNTFSKIPKLVELNLKENLMIQISANAITPLLKLRKLDISENPWSCNTKVLGFHKLVKERQIEMQPQCVESETKIKMFEKLLLDPDVTISDTTIEEKEDTTINWESEEQINIEIIIEKNHTDFELFREKFNKSVPADLSLVAGLLIGISLSILIQICTSDCIIKRIHRPSRAYASRRIGNQENSNLITFRPLETAVDTPPTIRRNRNLNQILVQGMLRADGNSCDHIQSIRPATRLRDSWQYIDFHSNPIIEENSIPPGTPPPSYRQATINAN